MRGARQSPPFQSLRFARITAYGSLRHIKGTGDREGALPSPRAAVLAYSDPKASLSSLPLPPSGFCSRATFTLAVENGLVAPRGSIWKVFDVLAIRGENAERLIPKSPKDKLARFSFGKEYFSAWRQKVKKEKEKEEERARARE